MTLNPTSPAASIPLPLAARQRTACAALTAVLWWMAGLQWGLFALGWVALLPFFYSLQGLNRRERWRQGYRTGWLCYALINWWIIPTVTRASPVIGFPSPLGFFLGLLAVTLIALIHGSFVALVALLWNPGARIFRRAGWLLPLAVAALWALLDAVRCETPLAHGWGALAYTQWRDYALLQVAGWAGQHGLTFTCVWFAASLALWLQRSRLHSGASGWCIPLIVFGLLHLAGIWNLARPSDTNEALHVLIVQTNILSLSKTFGAAAETPLAQAMRLSRAAVNRKYDLIVWPETTISAGELPPAGGAAVAGDVLKARDTVSRQANGASGLPARASLEMETVARFSHELRTPILFGANAIDSRSAGLGGGMRNAAVLMEPDGRTEWSGKIRLVPFGERAPFGDWLPFLKALAPQPELVPTTEPRPLMLRRPSGEAIAIGTIICFESGFPNPAHALRRRGARALFILTNDEWFDGTDAPGEHAIMSALRAAENGLATVQSANGGYATAVDQHGRFMLYGKYGVPAAWDVRLPLAP